MCGGVYLSPQNIPSPIVLTMGNKGVLYKERGESFEDDVWLSMSPESSKMIGHRVTPDTHISCQEFKFTVEMAIVRF